MSPSRYLRPGEFALIAHRGGALEAPENTIQAFQHSLDLYKDIIFELDVHRSRDGEIVVFHDNTLERTTNGHGNIFDHDWNDLKKLDAAYHFSGDHISNDHGKSFPLRGTGIGLPLLEDVLTTFPNSRVSIEFKTSNPFFGDKVVDMVRRLKAQDRVVLAGAEHGNLISACGLAPEMCWGYSSHEVARTLLWNTLRLPFFAPNRAHVYQVPFKHRGRTVVTPRFVKSSHHRSKAVHVWTVNDEATMRHLINIGADGIVTDAPRLLLKVAQELKKI